MFRTTKPPIPLRKPALGSSRSAPGRELDTALEFASIPLDRIVAPEEKKPSASAAPAFRSQTTVELNAAAKSVRAKMRDSNPLLCLTSDFPSVLNRLADVWHRPREFYALADSFLVDDRGNRQGFPFAALMEISAVVEFFETHEAPRRAALYDATQFHTKI